MSLKKLIEMVDTYIEDAKSGLPEEVFLFASRITPMVNIDLLIKDEAGRILLSWRDDAFCGKGWHIPGRIIRFKQSFQECIEKASLKEIGTIVEYCNQPIQISNIIHGNQDTRGHFISFLYECKLSSNYVLPNVGLCNTDIGFLKWHKHCPDDFLEVQSMYKKYFS